MVGVVTATVTGLAKVGFEFGVGDSDGEWKLWLKSSGGKLSRASKSTWVSPEVDIPMSGCQFRKARWPEWVAFGGTRILVGIDTDN